MRLEPASSADFCPPAPGDANVVRSTSCCQRVPGTRTPERCCAWCKVAVYGIGRSRRALGAPTRSRLRCAARDAEGVPCGTGSMASRYAPLARPSTSGAASKRLTPSRTSVVKPRAGGVHARRPGRRPGRSEAESMDAAQHGVSMEDAMVVRLELIENERGIHGEKCASQRAGCEAARDQVSGAKARRASRVVVSTLLARSHRRFHTRLYAGIHPCSRAAVLLRRQGTRGVSDHPAGRGLGSARGPNGWSLTPRFPRRPLQHGAGSSRAAQNAAHSA